MRRTPFDPARDIGMVFQQALLLKWRTVLDNVLLPAEIVGLPIKAARARARDLLNLVGLAGYEDKYPQQLSGGMQQRTAIARAFIHDPKLILMDEPFGALDALTREQMNLEMLRIWRESGKTIIFVTHSIQEAVFLGSHCAVLTAGPARMAEYFPISCRFHARCRSRPPTRSAPMHGGFMRAWGSGRAPKTRHCDGALATKQSSSSEPKTGLPRFARNDAKTRSIGFWLMRIFG